MMECPMCKYVFDAKKQKNVSELEEELRAIKHDWYPPEKWMANAFRKELKKRMERKEKRDTA